ncbi:cholesterol oxidase-like [Oscarella lobularis]|uniref:cholesterol oxidase-like n=1 Tax=Oscarella lobularis TaxID=121494 RepID=UPI0033130BE7
MTTEVSVKIYFADAVAVDVVKDDSRCIRRLRLDRRADVSLLRQKLRRWANDILGEGPLVIGEWNKSPPERITLLRDDADLAGALASGKGLLRLVVSVFKEAGKVRHPVARALLEYLDKKRAHSSDKKTYKGSRWSRLSSPIGDIKKHCSVVVIGSGYGGSISACRMARAGQEVCILEQGKELLPTEYPNTLEEMLPEIKLTLPDGSLWPQKFTDGFYDVVLSENVLIWKGCGLGGGSLVNSSIAIEPDKRVFDSWPADFRADMSLLEEGYQRARNMLCPAQYPEQATKPLKKFEALKKAAGSVGSCNLAYTNTTFKDRVNDQGIHQPACVLCGDCNTGCNYGSKNTLLMNYLPDAKQHGAVMFCRVWVSDICRLNDDKWLINCKYAGDDSVPEHAFSVTADIVMLGAGSLGSTEILLRSREQNGLAVSSTCGQKFGTDGDFFGLSYNGSDVVNGCGFGHRTPSEMKGKECGPCITGVWDLRDDTKPLDEGMIIEDINFPGPLAPLLSAVLPAASVAWGTDTNSDKKIEKLTRILESLAEGPYTGATQHNLMLGGMSTYGNKDQDGQLKLIDNRLCISFSDAIDPEHNATLKDVLRQAASNSDATFIKDPLANPLKIEKAEKIEASIHPLGGCIMGDSFETGVVNHKGQVWTGSDAALVYTNLYVTDGAVVPTSLGVNPLLTISAIAERISFLAATDRGWSIDYKTKEQVTLDW